MTMRLIRWYEALGIDAPGEPPRYVGRDGLVALLARQEAVPIYLCTGNDPEEAGTAHLDRTGSEVVVRLDDGRSRSAPKDFVIGLLTMPTIMSCPTDDFRDTQETPMNTTPTNEPTARTTTTGEGVE